MLQENAGMSAVFDGSLDPDRLLDAIAVETGVRPTEKTLVILDEIQECPRAITSLKMFQEQKPEIPIIAVGSLLGVAFHKGTSFPVGKMDHLSLYPLTFDEFLRATIFVTDILNRRPRMDMRAFRATTSFLADNVGI